MPKPLPPVEPTFVGCTEKECGRIKTPEFTATERAAVIAGLNGAYKDIYAAYKLFKDHGDTIGEYYKDRARRGYKFDGIRKDLHHAWARKKVIVKLERILRKLNNQAISLTFKCGTEAACDDANEPDAYVDYLGAWVTPFSSIHLCPKFFDGKSGWQKEVIIQELFRFYNGNGETGTKTWDDVYEWRNQIVNKFSTRAQRELMMEFEKQRR